MTQFNKSLFHISSGYATYQHKFVARFKYQAGSARGFVSFVAKNFTVEEYFGRLDAGEAPLTIAESRGYMLPHIKKILKTAGYEVSRQGFDKYIKDQVKLDRARLGLEV